MQTLKLARVDNINPVIKLRMLETGLTTPYKLHKAAQVPISSIYSSLGGRHEMGLSLSRKIAAALAFPYELFVKVYLEESLSDTELTTIAALCNISLAEAVVLVKNKKNLGRFYTAFQPEKTA